MIRQLIVILISIYTVFYLNNGYKRFHSTKDSEIFIRQQRIYNKVKGLFFIVWVFKQLTGVIVR